MATFGTLEWVEGSKKENRTKFIETGQDGDGFYHEDTVEAKAPYWKVTGHQPAMMLARIIANTWHPDYGVSAVTDNISNVEHIRWLMMRYPLEVKTPKWAVRIAELEQIENKRRDLTSLQKQEVFGTDFVGELYDFQKEGLDFLLKSNGTALLADDMGLGKTVTTLAYLCRESDAFPVLVVAPLVVLRNWAREITRFTKKPGAQGPTIGLIRQGHQHELPYCDYYIINYELLAKRAEDLERAAPHTIIADEVQNLRKRDTQKYSALKEISAIQSVKHRLGLSGTPCYNHGNEIWSIVDFLYPGLLGDYAEFSQEFVDDWNGEVVIGKRQALYEILTNNIMLRRRKTDVLKGLPAKTRYRQRVDVDKEYYEREMNALLAKIDSQIGRGNTSLQLVSQQQTALANGERMIAGVAKIPFVVDFVEKMMELEEPIVVYVHHLIVHQLLREKLSRFRPLIIIGGQTDNERQHAIDAFQEGESRLLIAGLRAGNLGINLTAASYVVFGELDWSPAIHRQAEDRLHRIGQEKPVFAYYLEGAHTYDEHIADLLTDKKLELDSILGDVAEPEQKVMDARTRDILAFVHNRFGKTLDISSESKDRIIETRERIEAEAKKAALAKSAEGGQTE